MTPNWRAHTLYSESISKLLRSLKLDDSLAEFIVTSRGVKIQTTAASRSYNGHLFLPVELFTTYDFEADGDAEISTTLSLTSIVHCLRMVIEWQPSDDSSNKGLSKSSVGCFFTYTPGMPLQISFAQGSMQTVCDLTTYESQSDEDIQWLVQLDTLNIQIQIIMTADVFISMLADLEAVASMQMVLTARQNPARLDVRGVGAYTSIEFTLPVETEEVETMIAEPGASFTYDFTNVGKCREVAKLASRISLRCDDRGTLSIQCQCDFDNDSCYVEFRYLAKA